MWRNELLSGKLYACGSNYKYLRVGWILSQLGPWALAFSSWKCDSTCASQFYDQVTNGDSALESHVGPTARRHWKNFNRRAPGWSTQTLKSALDLNPDILYHHLVWDWASQLSFLSPSFLIHKLEIKYYAHPRASSMGTKWDNALMWLTQWLASILPAAYVGQWYQL